MVSDYFHDFADLAKDETTWNFQCAHEYLIADTDRGLDARRHGFTLDCYKYEFGSPWAISLSMRDYLGSLVEKLEMPFREWGVLIVRNYTVVGSAYKRGRSCAF